MGIAGGAAYDCARTGWMLENTLFRPAGQDAAVQDGGRAVGIQSHKVDALLNTTARRCRRPSRARWQDVFTTNWRTIQPQTRTRQRPCIAAALLSHYTIAQVDGLLTGKSRRASARK